MFLRTSFIYHLYFIKSDFVNSSHNIKYTLILLNSGQWQNCFKHYRISSSWSKTYRNNLSHTFRNLQKEDGYWAFSNSLLLAFSMLGSKKHLNFKSLEYWVISSVLFFFLKSAWVYESIINFKGYLENTCYHLLKFPKFNFRFKITWTIVINLTETINS